MLEVCIIGFGFSAVPLIRELKRTGTEFQIISEEGNSVWDGLNETGRLDFDLVSSYISSFYSFDLVKDFVEDYYPTSRQFYEMHKRWRNEYEKEVVWDLVTKIDNFKDHSVIFTKSGKTIKARHVVCSTGFRRAIHTDINHIDYTVSNKTFVFDTMGDSANLIISKLIPNNNKIIIRTNGFWPLDKVMQGFGLIDIGTYTIALDQQEGHNFRYISHEAYGSAIFGLPSGSKNPIVLGDQFPVSMRDNSYLTTKSLPANGTIAIKYWPIDKYSERFGNNIEESISQGYLLNDIAMWLHTGKAIVVPKDTPIDFEKKTITYGGIERSFHQYIKGDREQPRLPEIMIDGNVPYEYHYRDNFMGVLPRTLNNIYLIGYTRPYTGGLANIIEMQGLFTHKLITQSEFSHKINDNLDDRLTAYNNHYYGTTEPRQADHLVYYGFYTDDIARLMEIDYKLSECTSMKDVMFYYAFPNSALKYRLKGEYAVEGVENVIQKVNQIHKNFLGVFTYFLMPNMMGQVEFNEVLPGIPRNLFNDMRYKEPYKTFMENYIEVYRKLKNATVDEIVDDEWNSMVKKASETRDKVMQDFHDSSDDTDKFKMTFGQYIQLIQPLMSSDDELFQDGELKIDSTKLDERQSKFLLSLINPKEYELAYLKS